VAFLLVCRDVVDVVLELCIPGLPAALPQSAARGGPSAPAASPTTVRVLGRTRSGMRFVLGDSGGMQLVYGGSREEEVGEAASAYSALKEVGLEATSGGTVRSGRARACLRLLQLPSLKNSTVPGGVLLTLLEAYIKWKSLRGATLLAHGKSVEAEPPTLQLHERQSRRLQPDGGAGAWVPGAPTPPVHPHPTLSATLSGADKQLAQLDAAIPDIMRLLLVLCDGIGASALKNTLQALRCLVVRAVFSGPAWSQLLHECPPLSTAFACSFAAAVYSSGNCGGLPTLYQRRGSRGCRRRKAESCAKRECARVQLAPHLATPYPFFCWGVCVRVGWSLFPSGVRSAYCVSNAFKSAAARGRCCRTQVRCGSPCDAVAAAEDPTHLCSLPTSHFGLGCP
jgi:hypothetical protein